MHMIRLDSWKGKTEEIELLKWYKLNVLSLYS